MRTALTVAIILCLISGCSTSGSGKTEFPPDKNPAETGRKVIDDLLSRPDFMMYNAGDVRAVHYAEACAGFGAARLAGFLGDKDRLRKITERYSRVLNENFENTANHVDVNVYGILPLELYRQNKDKKFLDQGLELADGQWKDPLSDGLTKQTRYWIDDIWMIA